MTQAQITKIIHGTSKHGSGYELVCFKDLETGKSLRTFVYDNCYNRHYWKPVLNKGVGAIIRKYILKAPGLMDADSKFTIG